MPTDEWDGVVFMKKLVFTAVAMIALLSVSGCVGIGKGKGKAPVAPPDHDQGMITLPPT
jgi:hypothetical protein